MSAQQQSNKPTKQSTGVVGQPLDRVDGRLKVTGGARFAAEWPLENMCHAVLVGSTIANGRIKSFDTREAEKVPGVLHIMTPENAPKLQPLSSGQGGQLWLPLRDAVVYYGGQYIAVVVADTLEQAQQAAALVRVNYDQQPPAASLER
ncbi:MAG TPA: hypothetical protein VE821_05995, partial [Pyrinomonadaceae bacterium]|nr:hypothetical protein [Pyrinomonadaceae bacterium]